MGKSAKWTMILSIAGLTFILPCVVSCLMAAAVSGADVALCRMASTVYSVDFEQPDEACPALQNVFRSAKKSRFSQQSRTLPHWFSSWNCDLPEFYSQKSSPLQQIPRYNSAFAAVDNPVRAGPASV